MDPWRYIFQELLGAFVLLGINFFSYLGCATQDQLRHPFALFKGVNYTGWAAEEYATPASDVSLLRLRETGANSVAIIITEYMDTKNSTEIYADNLLTPSESSILHVVQRAHSLGFKVMLKLHVDPKDGAWRGQISPLDVNAWFKSYQSRVFHYAKLAQSLGIELYCLGTELRSLSGKTFRNYWEQMILAIREVFTGSLVYAANWDEFQTVSFWDLLDYVGIDAYFPLSYAKTPSVEELLLAWDWWISQIETWQRWIGKPVIFTEVGYRSIDHAAWEPWDWSRTAPYNPQAQANCYAAVFRAVLGKPWFTGLFFWNWKPDPNAGGPGDLDYTPQNKPAEEILTRFFHGGGTTLRKSEKVTASTFASPKNSFEAGRKRGEACPVFERKEVVRREKRVWERTARVEFQNAKEV